jgi:hypothetical protein
MTALTEAEVHKEILRQGKWLTLAKRTRAAADGKYKVVTTLADIRGKSWSCRKHFPKMLLQKHLNGTYRVMLDTGDNEPVMICCTPYLPLALFEYNKEAPDA